MKRVNTNRLMNKGCYLLILSMMLLSWASGYTQDLQTGEWAYLDDGRPATIGQTTQDHIFARNTYNDNGAFKTYDNVVSFKSGAVQTVWLWLDDDQIYLNEKVQALPKSLIKDDGEPYNETTYNCFQCNIYLPEGIRLVKAENEDGDEISFVQGDRMPNSASLKFADNTDAMGPKVIDGINYQVYTLIITNQELNGTHFSSRNALAYQTNGALKKDDAPLVAIFLENDHQNEAEGQLADMIIANQEFGMREPFIVEPRWEPNDYRFIYGEGGNMETQRYQLYNRVALYGSQGLDDDMIYATGIKLNTTYKTLEIGEAFQLTATITPSNATNQTVTWESSNTNVATVDSNGLVRAISAGSATITATTTDGTDLTASCVISVKSVLATSITLNASELTLDIDETSQLIATVYPSNATNNRVAWHSSNNAVARVSINGFVTPVAPGNATITATTTDGTDLVASCQVTVVKRVKGITLNETSLTLTLPETAQLLASITPSDATDKTLNWTSSNSAVASVDDNGFVSSVAPGTATIRATTTDGSNLSASCVVTVREQLVTSISLTETSKVMQIGETAQLSAVVAPENASNKTLSWSTEDSSIATVSDDGIVTAIGEGTTYVTVSTTDGSDLSSTCMIQVMTYYCLDLDTVSYIRGTDTRIVDLPVSLINRSPVSGIRFDVALPVGLKLNVVDGVLDVWLDEARTTQSHSVTVSRLSNGNYRIKVQSSSGEELKGNDGAVVHMNLQMPLLQNTMDYTVDFSNIIASEPDDTQHQLNSVSTMVRVYYIVGDADANTFVDVADYNATASRILGKYPSPFYSDAANVDGSHSVDVADLVGITNIALEIDPITLRQAPERWGNENRLFCDKLELTAGGERELNVGMDCGFDFAGFQMDVVLPRGLTLVSAALGEDAYKLGLATEMMPDGAIRLLGTSFSDAVVNGICPELLKLRVKAESDYMPGCGVEFSEVIFAERDLATHTLDDLTIEYVEPSAVYELADDARIYVENGCIIVDTPVAGAVQLIGIDGRMVEYHAQVGHNVYAVPGNTVYIIHFNGKTIKVRL